jgi:hypothetical protein
LTKRRQQSNIANDSNNGNGRDRDRDGDGKGDGNDSATTTNANKVNDDNGGNSRMVIGQRRLDKDNGTMTICIVETSVGRLYSVQ